MSTEPRLLSDDQLDQELKTLENQRSQIATRVCQLNQEKDWRNHIKKVHTKGSFYYRKDATIIDEIQPFIRSGEQIHINRIEWLIENRHDILESQELQEIMNVFEKKEMALTEAEKIYDLCKKYKIPCYIENRDYSYRRCAYCRRFEYKTPFLKIITNSWSGGYGDHGGEDSHTVRVFVDKPNIEFYPYQLQINPQLLDQVDQELKQQFEKCKHSITLENASQIQHETEQITAFLKYSQEIQKKDYILQKFGDDLLLCEYCIQKGTFEQKSIADFLTYDQKKLLPYSYVFELYIKIKNEIKQLLLQPST